MSWKKSDESPYVEPGEPLEAWAARIATLEPEVAASVIAYSRRIAADHQAPKADREFSKAQAQAVEQAVARVTRR